MEVALTALMVALLGYQVTMPSNDNARYMFTSHNGQIVRMNTQDGTMEICNQHLKCKPIEVPEDSSK
jgi:hypothetical protein